MHEMIESAYESIMEEIQKLKTEKLILVISLIIPIFVNLIVGWELSKGVIDHVPLAVVDYDDSQLSRQIIQYFAENNTFDLNTIAESQEELKSLINEGKVKAGMVIPKNFSADVTSLKSPSVLMLYDGSYMSITSIAKAKASEILMTVRTGAAIKQLQGRLNMTEAEAYNTAMPISFENRTLYNPAKNFNYFMTPGYGTIICQTGIGLTAVLCATLLLGAPGTARKRNVLGYITGKTVFYGVLGSIAFITNILVQICLMKIPFKGSFLTAVLLSILLAFAVSALSVAVSAWIRNRVVAIVVAALLLIPNSILAGYTWPVISMIPFYQKGARIIPFYHYGDNIRNLFLKGTVSNLAGDAMFLVFFIMLMLLIGAAGIYACSYIKPKEVLQKCRYSLQAFGKK